MTEDALQRAFDTWFKGYTKREVFFAAEMVLSDRYADVLSLRFTGNHGRGMTIKEVASSLHSTESAIGCIYQKAAVRVLRFLNTGVRGPMAVRAVSERW